MVNSWEIMLTAFSCEVFLMYIVGALMLAIPRTCAFIFCLFLLSWCCTVQLHVLFDPAAMYSWEILYYLCCSFAC